MMGSIIKNVMYVSFLGALGLIEGMHGLLCRCSAQQDEGQSKRIPFQRVFIPSDDLTSIGIEDFIPIEVKRLEELFDRHSKNTTTNEQGNRLDNQGKAELVTSFYVAKLVGADLLSERSRLGFSGAARVGERFSLRPWSLAVQASTVPGIRPESQSLQNWSFDASGIPRVQLVPNDPMGAQSNDVPHHYASLFGWSLRAAADSTTHHLRYSMEIPKCANSCLVLALPPQAVIQDCTTVVKSFEDWSSIAQRLNDWPDFVNLPLEQNLVRSPESLWLIELGGSSAISFSILLGANRSKEDIPLDILPFKHLISSQKVEHFIEEETIRTTCEASMVGTQQQMMRFRLPEGARLRRLSVNQQDVEWEVEQGWIRWRMGTNPARNEDALVVELFSPFPTDGQSHFELPRIVFDRSYVMSGAEVVQCDPSWKLTHSQCETGRLTERLADPKSVSNHRIEYTWSETPPSHVIGLKRGVVERRSEFFTKLSNDPKKTTALVRVRLAFAEQDANHVSFLVAQNWQVISIQSLDPNDSITVHTKIDPNDSTEITINWGRLQKSRVADIELQLNRRAETLPSSTRRMVSPPLVQLVGWSRTDTIVVEDNPIFDFQLREALLDAILPEESMLDWQKALLPRSNKQLVLRFDASNSTLGATQAASIQLEWRETPNRLRASLKTEVDRLNATTLLARHEIELSLGADPSDLISVTLPFRSPIWRLKHEEKWTTLVPLASSPALADPTTGVWQFDSKQLGQEGTLMAVTYSEFDSEREVTIRMPQVSDAIVLSHEVRIANSDVTIQCDDLRSHWKIDPMGNKILVLTRCEKPVNLVARISGSMQLQKWLAMDSELHVAVDSFGYQKACLLLRTTSTRKRTHSVTLPDGWNATAIVRVHAGKREIVPFRMDGRRLVMLQEPQQDGELAVQIELSGPRLPKEFRVARLGQTFLFEWPKFSSDAVSLSEQRVLWLPRELQLTVSGDFGHRGSTNREQWPIWSWTRSLVDSLYGSTERKGASLPMRHLAAAYGLVPNWVSSHWRIALETPASTGGFMEGGLSKDRMVGKPDCVEILAEDADGSYLALWFVSFALVTPRLLLSRYKIATGTALALICCAYFLPESFTRWSYTGLIGMSTGFGVFVLYRMLAKPSPEDGSVSQRNSARWSVWDDREEELGSSVSRGNQPRPSGPSVGIVRSLSLVFAMFFACTSESSPFACMAFGQTKPVGDNTGSQDPVHQVVIPMDDSGNMIGTTVYVLPEMLNSLDGKRTPERGTQRIGARYGLRVGARGRVFGAADQIVMVYDFLVGDDLEAVRFPINVSQLQFPRFSLDGTELSIGPKLRNNGSEWVWTPDKAGRRTIQIVAQPVLKTNDFDRNRESITQSVDVAILPIANAVLDIETDVQNSVDVVTRGRVTDPAPGRFVAMLGVVDRLQCSFSSPIVKSGPFISPPANTSENADVPIINTELFLQGDVLQAKTIIEFPRGITTGREIEIEADSQWNPVGTRWGDDAEWVDTRPGSTVGRRRYLLEWKNYQNNTAQSSSRDRQISVIWVPQPSSTSLNILFAECRDRRTRRGTLRYARAFDSNWSLSLDGINAWIPAIGSKERLDWPEMSAKPIATSLRIPPSGGFGGVLKHKSQAERPQARVTTKWFIHASRENLSSVIEMRGGGSSNEPLTFDLPSDFSVSELYNDNGPVRYLQNRRQGKLRVQVLADRKSLEASFLILQAKRQELKRVHRLQDDNPWQELPWIVLSSSINSDQKLEITASENVVLQLESDHNLLLGKGPNTPMLNLEKSYSDIYSNTLASTRCQIATRDEPISGRLSVSLNSSLSPAEIEVVGEFKHSVYSRPSFVIEVPISLKDRLQNSVRTRSIYCPDASKAWLQVLLPENSTAAEQTDVSTLIRFIPRPEDIANDLELIRSIRPLDHDLISVRESVTPNESTPQVTSSVQSETRLEREHGNSPTIANWMMRIRNSNFQSNASERFVLLESEFWLMEFGDGPFVNGTMEWQLDDDAELLSIVVDGVPVEFSRQGQRVRCSLERAGLCAEMVLFSKHRVSKDAEGKACIHAPEIVTSELSDRPTLVNGPTLLTSVKNIFDNDVAVFVSGNALPEKQVSDQIGEISKTCLALMANTMERIPASTSTEPFSDFARWKRYWNQKAKGYLDSWSTISSNIDQADFGSAVARWHTWSDDLHAGPELKPQFMSNLADDSDPSHSAVGPQPSKTWIPLLGGLLILTSIHLLASVWPWLQKHPWWCLIGLGIFAWIVSGTLTPVLILGGVGLFVAADSYWILTSRLRRNGTRGLRSL